MPQLLIDRMEHVKLLKYIIELHVADYLCNMLGLMSTKNTICC